LNAEGKFPVIKLVLKPVSPPPTQISRCAAKPTTRRTASASITWMHTFSPAKMWIGGLSRARKPFMHLHTQLNRDIPWDTIDMDFMNLNQAAHGDREHGFIMRPPAQAVRSSSATGRTRASRTRSASGFASPPAWHD
jgi:L-arabinose isomerase